MIPRPMPVCRGPWCWPLATTLGAAETGVENIGCPPGATATGDAQGNVWCVDAAGNKVSATLTPVAQAQSNKDLLGVVGWGVLIAGALLVGAAIMSRKK